MSRKYADFKFSVGDKITSYGRNIEIIDKKYVSKQKVKNGARFIANEKYYKYRCLDCGNEDWIIEYAIDEKQHCGCNACCFPPKKVVRGINDISATAAWSKYLFKNSEDIYKYHKYSKEKVSFICPYCGREYTKPIHNVIANKGLSCVCGDGISYPNKYMYSLLEQLGLNFEVEKRFDWSGNRVYDFYIAEPQKIIIELHGSQHYYKPIIKSTRYRTLEEEQLNDTIKESMAKTNGIEFYYQINCSQSNSDFIKESIIKSGILDIISISYSQIDWDLCNEFALSNLVKTVCFYKRDNPKLTLHNIAEKYKLSYQTILRYIKIGNKYGWCDYSLNSDRIITENTKEINRGQKPIYCQSNDMYYGNANIVADAFSTEDIIFYPRQIRKSISRNGTYKGLKFIFISQEEFNNIKLHSPDKVVGDFFNIND